MIPFCLSAARRWPGDSHKYSMFGPQSRLGTPAIVAPPKNKKE
jgi:hypothetical protein